MDIKMKRIYSFLIFLFLSDISLVKCQESIIGMLNITGNDILDVLAQFTLEDICETIKNNQEDSLCGKQLSILCDNENVLLQMVDANSKIPYTGLFVRTNLDLGSYDECIDIDLTEDDIRLLGKHCTGGLILPSELFNLETNVSLHDYYVLSTCVPNACTPKDLINLLNIPEEYAPLLNDFACSTKQGLPMQWQDYTFLAFSLLICLNILVATLSDIYLASKVSNNGFRLFAKAFSLAHNGKQLLKTSKGSVEQIQVIHGLRVISMAWVILGHTFSTFINAPGINRSYLKEFEWSRKSTHITSLHLAVDTFFFLSGLLLAYQYLKQKPTSLLVHLKRIPLMYFQRYVRLTPVVASAFIILTTVFMHTGNGPLFYAGIQSEKDRCLKHWLAFFTYTQNYVAPEDMCMAHTWYLSADWQLFLISPIILIPVAILIKTHFKWIMGHLLIFNLLVGTALPMVLKMFYHNSSNLFETHTRLNVYFMGFMLGVYMREKQDSKWRLSKATNLLFWVTALLILIATTLAYKEVQLARYYDNDFTYDMYFVLLRVFWSLGLAWVIFACHSGYGGFVNQMLTTPTMQVLSKLTFCMYITHACPILYLRLTVKAPIEYSQLNGYKDAIFAYIVSLVLSALWTLVFESPLIVLLKELMRSKTSKQENIQNSIK
ncbi:nose resistant to fluoxetine protein 6-like [Anthonomus grandis grandis]|uniref:nose resistant to fluoxetine protein 6-like n=1 Tax=Anthonomus grandis grandis TaxID=2921223 RepID=UPI002165DF7C|nr:nose resistant to fluoxetine protein 6-like [Anthonomus grandis grandis]